VLLESEQLSLQQRQLLGQAIMLEEDDWFDWKAALEMLEGGISASLNLSPSPSRRAR
jgi:hypothetical protein